MTINNTTETSFTDLVNELGKRAARSYVSKLSPVNDALRKHLHNIFERSPGEEGAFLSEPVFEASFGWQPYKNSMQELSGNLLHNRLVEAMDSPSPELVEQRFDKTWSPYEHQVAAWQTLRLQTPKSIIVSSGTGSGKTECFLVPILNDLVQQLEHTESPVGVQALMLYPLNALISSQRDRLQAWMAPFDGRLRYCLYNGETIEQAKATNQRANKTEILSRQLLREEPSPILVTNATMLEYMLVRQEDQPILEKSKGKLRWIILDEAHTYIGSHAAEISLLLRRVLHAFGVSAKDVRFVATSATIGGDNEESNQQLQLFLADLAGVDSSRVSVIHGKRSVPALPNELTQKSVVLPALTDMAEQTKDELFSTLSSNPSARNLRKALVEKGPMTLSEMMKEVDDGDPGFSNRSSLIETLDLCRTATCDEKSFLPLRVHLFHRTQNGLWACCNNECPGRKGGQLDKPIWPFGKLFLSRREVCNEPGCDGRVFELVFCDNCGSEYFAVEETEAGGHGVLAPKTTNADEEEVLEEDALLEDDSDEDEEMERPLMSFQRLVTSKDLATEKVKIDPSTGQLVDETGDGQTVGMIYPEQKNLSCVRCGKKERRDGEVFRPARSSAAYHLLMSTPTLLEHTTSTSKGNNDHPFGGRRLITFSDSRQGTARFSLQAQLDAERNYVRSWLYHQISANVPVVDSEQVEKLQRQVDALRSNSDDIFKEMLEQKEQELEAASSVEVKPVSWVDAARVLMDTPEIKRWLREHWNHTPLSEMSPYDIAKMCLVREFARRPKRQASLETLGLVALRYPVLERVTEPDLPAAWKQFHLGLSDWRDFLKIAIDFVVRGNCAVRVPPDHSRWMGIKLPTNFLVGPDVDEYSRFNVRWPLLRSLGSLSRLPSLLVRALELNLEDREDRAIVNELLQEAWQQLRSKLLEREQEGYRLDLEKHVEFYVPAKGWLCHVTRKFLDTTLMGWSPYLSTKISNELAMCEPVTMPALKYPFGLELDDSIAPRREISRWLEEDERIAVLRDQGLWTAYNDRLALYSNFYRINEHSAQQESKRLRSLEKEFKASRINILSCSTTMEMGVDIGGVSSVAMNNAPPSPVNYLQRAGRAGRRKETASVSFTLCQSVPHGEHVFANPTWPFRTRIYLPRVSLESNRIVQRHINALVLTRFLQKHAQNLIKLQCGWFFLREEGHDRSPAETLSVWVLNQKERSADDWLLQGVKALVERTSLSGVDPLRLLENVGHDLRKVIDRWVGEESALARELEFVGGSLASSGKMTPAQAAITKQLKRIREEYLLGELASKGFLPGYGFPTSVVPFINTTLEDIKREKKQQLGREDNRMMRRGYPTRDLPIAIRDYAPGTDIVVDGQVYTSEGVTLNWHIPAGDYVDVPEVQAFRTAWRCRKCGASGTRSSRLNACPVCNAENEKIKFRPYLEPAGFAVNIYQKPHNDLSYRKYIPIQKPWISAGQTPWSPLPRPELGRYRFSHYGQIFHQSGGLSGHGYAICLRCGKAVSETREGGALPNEMLQHKKLRGGKEENGQTLCQGNENEWAIKRNQWLGASSLTDVFELQLLDPETGAPVGDDDVTYSLAAALRQALAEKLGVTDREISCAGVPSRTSSGQVTHSVVLYDTSMGGAGFVAAAAQNLPGLLLRAREILTCAKDCDAACHSCLLSYDTQFEVNLLNRHNALAVLTPRFLEGLRLPERLHYFGEASRLEFDALEIALMREMQHVDFDEIRLYLGGESKNWDLLDWPIKKMLLKFAGEGRRVSLFASQASIQQLDPAVANPLASLVEMDGISLNLHEKEVADPGVQSLIAEMGGRHKSLRWALSSQEGLCPSSTWGKGDENDRCVMARLSKPLPEPIGVCVSAEDLRLNPPGTYLEVIIGNQLDGPIQKLGARFWSLIVDKAHSLEKQFSQKTPISSIVYRDRYVASPLVIRILKELLSGLRSASQGFVQSTEIIVETVDSVRSAYRPPEFLHNDWAICDQRNAVIKALMDDLGCRFKLVGKTRFTAQHARELIIHWSDGRTWTARLDHGVGFLKSRGSSPFDFNADGAAQSSRLSELNFNVKNGMEQGSHLYLTDVLKS